MSAYCTGCGKDGPDPCEGCQRKAWDRARNENPNQALLVAGLSRREVANTADGVTPEIRAAVPSSLEERGFGLSGRPGIGKTGAMAALLREWIRTNEGEARWLSWPETVNWMRITSMQAGGIESVGIAVERAIGASVLVLDDLGAERIKGSYLEDWAASQLDLIVDGRYRDMRPTWYTTALPGKEIGALYGPRLYSRLCGENPLIELPKLADRRV